MDLQSFKVRTPTNGQGVFSNIVVTIWTDCSALFAKVLMMVQFPIFSVPVPLWQQPLSPSSNYPVTGSLYTRPVDVPVSSVSGVCHGVNMFLLSVDTGFTRHRNVYISENLESILSFLGCLAWTQKLPGAYLAITNSSLWVLHRYWWKRFKEFS